MRKTSFLVCVLGILLWSIPNSVVFGEVDIKEIPNVVDKFLIGAEVNTFYRFDTHPYYGAPIGATRKTSNNWGEIFGRLNFTIMKDYDWAKVEAKLSPCYMVTIKQDVYGLTKDERDLDINKAYIKFGKFFDSPFDVTVGMQDINIEKMFLIGVGRTQTASKWLLFNQSWPFGVKVDGDFGEYLKATAFWARSGDEVVHTFEGKDDLDVAGVNVHFDISESGYLYGGAFAKFDDTPPGTIGALGQNLFQTDTYAFSIGGDYTLSSEEMGALWLEAEAAYEGGDIDPPGGGDLDRDAFAWFTSAQYTLPVDLSPFVRFHYVFASGEEGGADNNVHEWDPMFWGWYVWNRWVIGELIGETQGMMTNTRKYIAEVGFSPLETMVLHGMYIKHQLDEKYFPFGVLNPVPVGSHNYADELNIFMDWQATDNIWLHTGVGYIHPNKSAKEIFGDDQDAFFGQIWAGFTL